MPVHIFITIKTAVTKQQLRHLYTCFNRSNKPASDLTEEVTQTEPGKCDRGES